MQLQIEPDLAIPFPQDDVVFANFREKALAACNSAEFLGLDLEPTEEERATAEQAVYQLAENEDKANKTLVKQSAKYTPATYKEVKSILDEYSIRVVDNALQIRLLVTNKLLIESQNEDAKVRLRALELLGKITDVGLFTEKSEVTVNHRSTEDLVNSIRSKIQRLMHPKDVEDAKVIEVNGETVDLDQELGLEAPKTDADNGE